MSEIRLADPTDYRTLYDLLFVHKRIGKDSQTEFISFQNFINKLNSNIVIFLYEPNNVVNSYMITYKLYELPIWVMRLIVTRPKDKIYKPESNGIAALYDYAINYWESFGITTFTYIQPKSYMKSSNIKLRNVSKKLQTYSSFTLYQYDKNQPIKHPLSRKIAGQDIFTNDVVIRIHYKNEIS
jgi:hypothetical protein